MNISEAINSNILIKKLDKDYYEVKEFWKENILFRHYFLKDGKLDGEYKDYYLLNKNKSKLNEHSIYKNNKIKEKIYEASNNKYVYKYKYKFFVFVNKKIKNINYDSEFLIIFRVKVWRERDKNNAIIKDMLKNGDFNE